ncbi:MAG: efflux RND transporter periplasmic adaptor subunit [Deltaproteobacteria bacterium]|nr:efflux RND transporter periplasmic adaptor subunit [Deltaproteobacteria bacterium]
MKTGRKKLALILGTGVALACAIFIFFHARFGVATVAPKRGAIVEAVYGLGTVTATRTYNLKIGITSHVEDVFVVEGDRVGKGARLARLSDAGVQLAPFAGTVTAVAYKPGETVFPQTTVVSLVDLSSLYVLVSLEEQAALHVRAGQVARLSFETIRGERLAGRVRSIYPQEGQFLVRIDLDTFPAGVLPGMTADVAIEVAQRADVLLIPVAAVSGGKVIVTNRGSRRKIDVKLGTVDGEWAEVVGGELSVEDEVVVGERKEKR